MGTAFGHAPKGWRGMGRERLALLHPIFADTSPDGVDTHFPYVSHEPQTTLFEMLGKST